jgi:hypothetical protein
MGYPQGTLPTRDPAGTEVNVKMDFVGDPAKTVLPEQVPVENGKYLITNGGFFKMGKIRGKRPSIGPTNLSPKSYPTPSGMQSTIASSEKEAHF